MPPQGSSPETRPSAARRMTGVEAMALAAFFFSLMSVCVKLLGSRFSTQQIVFIRNLLTLGLTAVALFRHRIHPLGSHRGLLFFRGLSGFAALSCFFYGVMHLPLAVATVVQFTNPIFTAFLAATFLNEKLDRRSLWSALLGLAGVIFIARPWEGDLGQINRVALFVALMGAILSSFAYVSVRKLSIVEEPLVSMFYFPLVGTPISGLTALSNWIAPSLGEWGILLAVGATAQVGQFFMTRGLYRERAGRATTVGYLQLAFAAAWGMLFFAEVPSVNTLLGSILIILSVVRLRSGKAG